MRRSEAHVPIDSATVVEAVEGVVHYETIDQPIMEIPATARRTTDQQWAVEVVLPRGRVYEFNIDARDDKGRKAETLRVTVNP